LLSLRNGIGETALHFLAVENDMKGVAWLHARGFDLNAKNHFRNPVIFEVAQLGYKQLLLWFVENGADPNAHNAEQQDIATSPTLTSMR
jgi:ankyrin repeat protein